MNEQAKVPLTLIMAECYRESMQKLISTCYKCKVICQFLVLLVFTVFGIKFTLVLFRFAVYRYLKIPTSIVVFFYILIRTDIANSECRIVLRSCVDHHYDLQLPDDVGSNFHYLQILFTDDLSNFA